MASAVVELNLENDPNLASKSSSQLAAVENLPVHNIRDEKNKEVAQKCNHFSIRGYVSEVRKRDPKLCYPFTLQDSVDLRDELPPMVVPNFRWWRCSTCVPEAAKNNVNPDASILLVGQSSKVITNADRVRNAEASTSNDSNNKNFSPISDDRKGKGKAKAHFSNEIPRYPAGCENALKVSCQQIPQPTLGQIKVMSVDNNEVQNSPKYNQNGTIRALHTDCRGNRADIGPSDGYLLNNAVAGVLSGPCGQSSAVVKLPDLNECGGEPSSREVRNRATVSGNNINPFCEDDDDYLGSERRKKPKVRLLSELLGLTEVKNPAKGKKKALSSTSSQDEGLKPVEIRGTIGGSKKLVKSSDASESEYETDSDDVSTEKISKVLAKRRCQSRDKDSLVEKRNKRVKMDHGDSSSLVRPKIKVKSTSHEKMISSVEMTRNLDVLTRVSEQKSILTKKRGRVPQVQKESSSVTPPSKSQLPKECATSRKDGETEVLATENVCKVSENRQFPSSAQGERVLNADNNVNKDIGIRNIEKTSVAFKSTVTDAPSTGKQSNSSEKESSRASEVNRSIPLGQHMPMPMQVTSSTATQKDLTNEVRGRIQDIDINTIPTDDKPNDQGPGDDIPMDIVELMAKNQYERHLDDPKTNNNSIKPADFSGSQVKPNGIYGSNGEHIQNSAQSHFFTAQNSSSAPFPLCNERFGHYTYNNSNNFGYRVHPGENARFLSPIQAPERIRPYSARGVSPNNWNGNINAVIGQKRYTPSFIHTVDHPYQKHRPVGPNQSVWSSGMGSRMPLGITNPRMISQSATVLNKGRIHHQSSGTFLNFENPQSLNFSNASYNNSENPESSVRSVDVNEAIPAMHLLSLMQNNAAAKVQSTDLTLGPHKVVGPDSSRYPFSKPNNSHPCYATARPFPLAYQNDGRNTNIGRTSSVFVGPIPLTSSGQRNIENSHFVRPCGDHRILKRPLDTSFDKRKGLVSMGKRAYKNPLQGMKDFSNMKYYETGVKHVDKSPDKMICRLNQNPSEFNDLKLVARYMIGPEDLKRRKMARDKVPRPRGNSKRQNIKVNKPIPSLIAATS